MNGVRAIGGVLRMSWRVGKTCLLGDRGDGRAIGPSGDGREGVLAVGHLRTRLLEYGR